jgi:hypothetical protein
MDHLRYIETTRQQAALRQIDAAIGHLLNTEPECAITLAAAAENILPDTNERHVWKYWREHPKFREVDMNETVNWLKHHNPPDERFIFESEVAFVIFRAMTKYAAVYKEAPPNWIRFLQRGADRGYFPKFDASDEA